MFAAVNAQIALELFLKYLYVKTGKANEIQKTKKGEPGKDFVDFSQILGQFYSSRKWSYGEKKQLTKLMETRNAIVHRGQHSACDKELATSIVRTLFFIHATAWSDIGETLLFDNYKPHRISGNKIWREGVMSFVKDISAKVNARPRTCLACYAQSVVNGEVMVLEEDHCGEHLICLNCLTSINTSHEAQLIECYVCKEKTYLVDKLNEQDKQLYVAKCSECETDTWVRMCRSCKKIYHPLATNEVQVDGNFFCSPTCVKPCIF